MKYLFSHSKGKLNLLTTWNLKLRLNLFFVSGKIVFLTGCLGTSIFVATPQVAVAQTNPNNTLAIDRDDPLIPPGYGKRELTSFEKYRINQEIASIDIAAKTALSQNDVERAMKLWYRQLRLARVLDKSTEVVALGKVGEVAWLENRSTDVRNIAQRLIAIEAENNLEKAATGKWLNQLAVAYEQVRYLDKAIDVYQVIVKNNRANHTVDRITILRKIGQLYLAIFDYQNAANIYQELLDNDLDKKQQQSDLKTLISIYESTAQFDLAIAARKRLIQQHIAQNQIEATSKLEVAIAGDYATLKQLDKAIKAYDRALQTAIKTQQLALANEALLNIGKLYQQQNNINKAIATYNKLIAIQQQSYNHYGLIDTYDTLGQIYLKSNQQAQAKQHFKQGLELAKSLDYKVEYFNSKINSTQ